jgi:hypothetical protein
MDKNSGHTKKLKLIWVYNFSIWQRNLVTIYYNTADLPVNMHFPQLSKDDKPTVDVPTI